MNERGCRDSQLQRGCNLHASRTGADERSIDWCRTIVCARCRCGTVRWSTIARALHGSIPEAPSLSGAALARWRSLGSAPVARTPPSAAHSDASAAARRRIAYAALRHRHNRTAAAQCRTRGAGPLPTKSTQLRPPLLFSGVRASAAASASPLAALRNTPCVRACSTGLKSRRVVRRTGCGAIARAAPARIVHFAAVRSECHRV